MHAQGLVHRDVKPSNVLFVNGQPKLADAGLVAAVDDARSLVGTPGYIPPEGPGTPQADIYSLGKVLYEAAFGKDRQEFPQLPPDLATRSDHAALLELNEIIAKACAHDPRERYTSAEAMLSELELLQSGRSVRRAHVASHRRRLARGVVLWGVVAALVLTFLTMIARRPTPVNPELRKRSRNKAAQDAYDVGRRYLRENDDPGIAKAAEAFQAAVKADTNFALAWAALAATWCYPDIGTNHNFALLPRVREVAEQALTRDDTLGEAHLALGWYAALWEWDWPKAKATQHFEKAIRLDPNNPQAHEWYGLVLCLMGKTNEAIAHLEKAVALDPSTPAYLRHYGAALLAARRYSDAVGTFEKCVQMQRISMNLRGLQEALEGDGQIDRAIDVSVEADKLDGMNTEMAAARARQLHDAYHESKLLGLRGKQLELNIASTTDPVDQAELYAAAGQAKEALNLLEDAYRAHAVSLVWYIKTDAQLDSLRSEPRFNDLLKRLNLD